MHVAICMVTALRLPACTQHEALLARSAKLQLHSCKSWIPVQTSRSKTNSVQSAKAKCRSLSHHLCCCQRQTAWFGTGSVVASKIDIPPNLQILKASHFTKYNSCSFAPCKRSPSRGKSPKIKGQKSRKPLQRGGNCSSLCVYADCIALRVHALRVYIRVYAYIRRLFRIYVYTCIRVNT